MNSPLQGGQLRRSRRGRQIAERTRFAPRVLVLVLLSAAATAAWLVLGEAKTTEPSNARHAALGALGATTHRRPKPRSGVPPPGITLFGAKPLRVHFKQPPAAGVVFNLKTGQILWAHKPLKRLPIASLTKIMTAIIVTERVRPNERALITREALHYTGSGVGVLPRGKYVPVRGLMAGMLLPSGNDAALALADHVAGTDRRFVRLMNQRARSMGLSCTHYSSAYGLPDTNRSCAVDLARLAQVAMSKPWIASVVRQLQAKVRFPIRTGYLYVTSTNPLLHARYPGTIGLKTGSTIKAGHCFVGVVRRGNRTLGVVLLHSPNELMQAEQLLNAAFKVHK